MRLRKRIVHLKERIALNKKTFFLYTVLRGLVILTAIRCFFQANFEGLALCILSLILFLVPGFLEEKMKIDLPPLFECIIYAFIYAAEILGEVNKYYTRIPGWDTMLHTLNGFLCAAIGFSLVDILNRKSKNIKLSPFYLTVVGFCFSMTVGVIWEFFEYTMDSLFFLDMQKDFIVTKIGTVTLDPTKTQTPVIIDHIAKTVIFTSTGKTYTINGGYLDIGINDTMKDLLVNCVGALIFSVFGYIYEKTKSLSKKDRNPVANIAASLMVSSLTDEELKKQEEEILERQTEIAEEKRRRKEARIGKDNSTVK
ncbi:MAG: hypothetical protein PUG16_04705 [Lachnospiraceae bacterium]|nr:hypothetical protein [Lachnospiraceae bacterium]